jgi:hypothetical protein
MMALLHIVCLFSGKEQKNLDRDIGLCDIELEKVAHLQAIVVHPSL